MSKENKQEINIFSTEQLQILDSETQKEIVFLSDNLPTKELLILNPLVSKLIEIQSYRDTIKYVADDKESIEAYKEASKDLKATIKLITETKSTIKRPLDALGKSVLAIEKTSKSIVEDVITTIDYEFSEYLKKEEERKEAARLKREEKEREKVRELEEQSRQANQMLVKTNILNSLKYEIPDAFSNEVMTALESYSVSALIDLQSRFNGEGLFESKLSEIDKDKILSEEEMEICKTIFDKKISDGMILISRRIDQLKLIQENESREAIEAKVDEKVSSFVSNFEASKNNFKQNEESIVYNTNNPEDTMAPPVPENTDNYLKAQMIINKAYSEINILISDNKNLLSSSGEQVSEQDAIKHKKIVGTLTLLSKVLNYIKNI